MNRFGGRNLFLNYFKHLFNMFTVLKSYKQIRQEFFYTIKYTLHVLTLNSSYISNLFLPLKKYELNSLIFISNFNEGNQFQFYTFINFVMKTPSLDFYKLVYNYLFNYCHVIKIGSSSRHNTPSVSNSIHKFFTHQHSHLKRPTALFFSL